MKIQVCKLDFRQFSFSGLDTFAELILGGLYQNAAIFVTPPYTEEEFVIVKTKFIDAYVQYDKFGLSKKTEFDIAFNNMMAMLNALAAYVNSVALGDASKIVLSGFEPTKEVNQPAQPLLNQVSYSLKRSENSGEIIVNIASLRNFGVVNYGCLCIEGNELENVSIVNGQLMLPEGTSTVRYDLNKSKRKMFSNLKVGVVYFFYVYAVNSVSVSPLSSAQKLMAA